MATDKGSFIWYELMTTDADAATAFYRDVVGWTVLPPEGDAGFDYRMIVRRDGGLNGGVLALTEAMVADGAAPGWIGYVCTPDIDAALATASADGATVLHDRVLDGTGRVALLTDPQGALVYLMAPTPPADDPDAKSDVFSVDRPEHVRWNELVVPDDAAAVAFYTRLLGWTQDHAMPMGAMGDYRFLTHDGVDIGAVMRWSEGMPHRGWCHYIGVDDIDRAAAAVSAGGGQAMGEPMPVPGGEFSLHARDPQGAFFGLVGPRR